MSGPIQPISSVLAQAVQQPATVPAGERAGAPPEPLPSPAAAPAVAAPAVLELSEFAQALEKLAQNPAIDPRLLSQLAGIAKEQGELLRLLGMLGGRRPERRRRRLRKGWAC